MLDSDSLSDQDRGFVEIVYRNAERLNQLIDDLLVLDQAEIGASMMHLEQTPVGPFVDARAIELLRGRATRRTSRSSPITSRTRPRCSSILCGSSRR